MKYDTLLFSRTVQEDYKWIRRPAYLGGESFDRLMRPLFYMVEAQKNKQFFQRRGRRNLYFFVEEAYCVLCYLYFTSQEDLVGRPIYALEGICCSRDDCRILWKNLPGIIYDIYEGGVGLRTYLPEGKICQFPEYLELPDYSQRTWDSNCDGSILNLVDEMQSVRHMYSFVFGTEEASFYPAKANRYYRIKETRKNIPKAQDYVTECQEYETCDVKFFFHRAIRGFYLSVLALKKNGEFVFGYDKAVSFGKEGIPLKTLVAVYNEMITKLEENGFWVNYSSEQLSKRPSFQLKKSRELLQEKELPFYRISGMITAKHLYCREYASEAQEMICQLFQYSLRIKDFYYEKNNGKETVYILNLKSGVWAFTFEKSQDGYQLNGIWVEPEHKFMGWCCLRTLLERYVANEISYSLDFQDAYEEFSEQMFQSLQPQSCIITSLPERDFPSMGNMTIYTVREEESLFNAILEGAMDLHLDNRNFDYDNIWILPPSLGKKWWSLHRLSRMGMLDRNLPISSIEEGSCMAEHLFQELGMKLEKYKDGF